MTTEQEQRIEDVHKELSVYIGKTLRGETIQLENNVLPEVLEQFIALSHLIHVDIKS